MGPAQGCRNLPKLCSDDRPTPGPGEHPGVGVPACLPRSGSPSQQEDDTLREVMACTALVTRSLMGPRQHCVLPT